MSQISFNVSNEIHMAIKRSAMEAHMTIKEFILSKIDLEENELYYKLAESSFAKEWLSEEDEEAFAHLQEKKK